MIDTIIHHELFYVVSVCIIILLVVVGGYVFMFLLIMKSDPREREFRKKHGWDNSLVPFKYKDQKKKKTK